MHMSLYIIYIEHWTLIHQQFRSLIHQNSDRFKRQTLLIKVADGLNNPGRSSLEFNKMKVINKFPGEAYLVTMDVKSLCTSYTRM